ncbi:hypothetical protein SAMN04489732_101164 [Amycolatopsis saalfeldensis]|uniref:Uncharacterized protein n=2 Tax=Amycolatopsis saalfeldensis TaxID=394193 RepID=A0A1H8Q169_9PSEU|nr:hypothetical protein SAMN04489732_101164 [Amycolatopsis saalfeldensis]
MLAEPALQGEFLKAYAATDLYPVLLAITDDDVPVTLRRSAGRV